MAATAVTTAQNRAIAKGTDPKSATCRAKLQRARSALNRQMDRELRLREGAENLLRATSKDGGGDNGGIGVGNKSKSRKLIRQTVALELSFLESNVRLLADELAELNGSVDVYQHWDEDDVCSKGRDFDGHGRDPATVGVADGLQAQRQRRRQRQMPMIAVPLKDTRPIDFGPPLERFISQHYGVDLSAAPEELIDGEGDGDDGRRQRLLSLREAMDELTQLRLDTQTPSRDADGVRLLLRYYRQLYYVDRRFFPPSTMTMPTITTTSRQYHHHHHHQQQQQQLATVTDASSTPAPAIYFEWYDSFGGPVPSCGQRTVRFEQACVLFNVAAVHTQMGAKFDRRSLGGGGGRDDDESSGAGGKPATSCSTSTGPEAADGATAAAQCFLRAAGAYRHIGDTFANAPARAADLRATGVLYAVMMAQAHECIFEKTQWRLLATIRHRCRRNHGSGGEEGRRRKLPLPEAGAEVVGGDRRGRRGAQDSMTRRTSVTVANEITTTHTPSWTELAREAAHVSQMYAEVVYSHCRPNEEVAVQGSKENGSEHSGTESMLPEVWVSVCRIKDRHYAALAYRYAACALLPYYRYPTTDSSDDRNHYRRLRQRDRYVNDDDEADLDADELLTELTTAAATAGLEVIDDEQTTSPTIRQERRRKQLGKLLLEAAAAAHDRAARALRLCRQLRGTKVEGNPTSGGGGLLAGVLDRERQRTVRLLLMHRHDDDEYATPENDDDKYSCCCHRRRKCDFDKDDDNGDAVKMTKIQDLHDCCSDDEGVDTTTVIDYGSGSGDQEEFTAAGIAGIPGLDIDRGVLIRPRTKLRLMSIAPDFTDTGDSEGDIECMTTTKRRDDEQQRQKREHPHEAADREERRADLFAGLGPVAVFSARHWCTRPRWVKLNQGGRHDDDGLANTDPVLLINRWFGFELRSHGGGTAAAVPPATVGHVRSNSQAQLVGLRRGDIVVALKCIGDGGRVLDVRWETCRQVAELIVRHHQRRRQQNSSDVQLKVVTPITAATAASDGHTMATIAMDPNKMYPRRRPTTVAVITSPLHSNALPLPPPHLLPQSGSKQQRIQWQQNINGTNQTTDSGDKMNTWSWNPFRRRRRSVVGNKC